MHIGLVTDIHYCSRECMLGRRFPKLALQRLREAMARFSDGGADLIVCLGDLIDVEDDPSLNEGNLRTASEILRSAGLPCVCLMGNHDCTVFSPEQFAAISGLPTAPLSLEYPGIALHFLNANFFWDGTPYRPGHVDWTQARLSPGEMDRVRAAAADASRKHFYFLHQCLDPGVEEHHILRDAPEVGALLSAGRTAAVFSGHYHPGRRGSLGTVPCITLAALCEGEESSAVMVDTDDFPV